MDLQRLTPSTSANRLNQACLPKLNMLIHLCTCTPRNMTYAFTSIHTNGPAEAEICIYKHTHIHTQTYIRMDLQRLTPSTSAKRLNQACLNSTRSSKQVCMCIVYVCVCVYIYIYIYMCVCVNMHVNVHKFMCTCIHTYALKKVRHE